MFDNTPEELNNIMIANVHHPRIEDVNAELDDADCPAKAEGDEEVETKVNADGTFSGSVTVDVVSDSGEMGDKTITGTFEGRCQDGKITATYDNWGLDEDLEDNTDPE